MNTEARGLGTASRAAAASRERAGLAPGSTSASRASKRRRSATRSCGVRSSAALATAASARPSRSGGSASTAISSGKRGAVRPLGQGLVARRGRRGEHEHVDAGWRRLAGSRRARGERRGDQDHGGDHETRALAARRG